MAESPAVALFHEALDVATDERESFVRQACKDDPALLSGVLAALAADDALAHTTFLQPSRPTFDGGMPRGTRIGPYELLELLGSGGMGEVYLAQQSSPICRRVALKVIKLGMDSGRIIARFESERQALALMDHPNVARVLDAGRTDDGRPYFVMEHVAGIPITTYCDRNRLPIHDRLRLFIDICEGVQHAHQKGIVHRDLKPSNILVTVLESKPLPKVIDFGVAKATHTALMETSLVTEQGQIIGTPEYMSPEQAEMTGLNIDTRTDVYSLGVLLYMLLCGQLPFETDLLRGRGFADLQRVLRDTEPLKPSARIVSDAGADAATRRQTDLNALRRRVTGDLDWIVMKAMAKDRTRRYSAVSELAADIERHLDQKPVAAAPPGVLYRTVKFLKRHKTVLLGAGFGMIIALTLVVALRGMEGSLALAMTLLGAIAGALLLGLATTALALAQARRQRDLAHIAHTQSEQAVRVANRATDEAMAARRDAERERDIANDAKVHADEQRHEAEHQMQIANAVNDFLNNDLLASASPERIGRDVTMRQALDAAAQSVTSRFKDEPLIEASIRVTMGATYKTLGLYAEAESHLQRARDVRLELLGAEDPATLTSQNELAALYYEQERDDEAGALTRETLRLRKRVLGEDHEDTLVSMNHLALVETRAGRFAEAESLYERTLEIRQRVLGPDHPEVMTSMNNLAGWYFRHGQYEQAAERHHATLEARRRVLGPDHPHTIISMSNLGGTLCTLGRYDEAEILLSRAVEIARERLGADHAHTGACLRYYGQCLVGQRRLPEAERVLLDALRICETSVGATHARTRGVQTLLDEVAELREHSLPDTDAIE